MTNSQLADAHWVFQTEYVPRRFAPHNEVQRFNVPTWRLQRTDVNIGPRAVVRQTGSHSWEVTMTVRDGISGKVFDDLDEAKAFVLAIAKLEP